jgi:hypothetical protein
MNLCKTVSSNGVAAALNMTPLTQLDEVGFVDTVFMNDSKYANEEAFLSMDSLLEALKQWVPLSSSRSTRTDHCALLWLTFAEGRGYVCIPEDERKRLDGPPYDINPLHRRRTHEAYMLSGFHQLHCLVCNTLTDLHGSF